MLGFLSAGIGGAANAAGGLFSGLQTVFGWLKNALTFLVGGFLKVGALLAGVVVGGLVSFAAAIAASTQAALAHARAVIDLRNSTGMSTGMAQGVASRFGAFGFKPGDLNNGGQYHGITSMTGRMFGVNAYDPTSINSRAHSYGGGMMGFMLKNAMLSGVGMNNPQGQWLANLPQNKVREQAAWQGNMTSKMGVGPEVLRKFAEDLPLLMQRFEMFRNLLVQKVAATALPFVQRGFERLSEFLSAHGETMGEAVGKGIEWLMNAFTALGSFLMEHGSQITDAIFNIVSWLYASAPGLIIHGLETLIQAGMGFVTFFANLGHSIANQLRLFDQSQGGLYAAVKNIAGIFDGIINTFNWFGAGLAVAGALVHDAIAGALQLIPGGGLAAQSMGFDMTMQNPIAAAGQYFADHPDSNIAGMIPQLQTGTATGWADSLDAGASAMENTSNTAGGAALTYLQGVLQRLGPEDKRSQEALGYLRGLMSETQKGNQIAAQTAKNTGDTADGMGAFGARVVGVATSQIVEDLGLAFMGS